MMTILFVGSNPSNASTCDAAFHGSARSSQILSEWTKDIKAVKVHINVINNTTENNRPLSMSEIKGALPRLSSDIDHIKATKIVALGKTAAKALGRLGMNFYEMPHPSGRNRLLNDPKYVEQKVKGLIEYVNELGIQSPSS